MLHLPKFFEIIPKFFGHGLFSQYTPGMLKLNNDFVTHKGDKFDPSALYLFVLQHSGEANATGDMPRSKQFGYLFTETAKKGGGEEAIYRTIAHEVSHGIFRLKHTFDSQYGIAQASIQNLMDYTGGMDLVKHQWDAIHAPGLVIGMFERDEDGMSIDRIAAIIEAIRSSRSKTPGTQIEIPWYGGTSSMSGAITINGETFDCEIYLRNETHLFKNKVRFTVPDFAGNMPSFNKPGQSSGKNTYYSKNTNYITFNEIKIKVQRKYAGTC